MMGLRSDQRCALKANVDASVSAFGSTPLDPVVVCGTESLIGHGLIVNTGSESDGALFNGA